MEVHLDSKGSLPPIHFNQDQPTSVLGVQMPCAAGEHPGLPIGRLDNWGVASPRGARVL